MLVAKVSTLSQAMQLTIVRFSRLSIRNFPFLIVGMVIISSLLALTVQLAPVLATGISDLPAVHAGSPPWVVDTADVLSRSSEGQFSNRAEGLAAQTGKEIRIAVIRRLDYGETIDSFADKLFTTWYPTPQERANQVLLVMDTLTNSVALRRGEALSESFTEDFANSLVGQTVAYPLRNGSKYNQAALNASERLVAVLSGQPDPGPPEIQGINIDSTYATAEETDDRSATIWVIVLLALATLIPMATYFWYVGLPGR